MSDLASQRNIPARDPATLPPAEEERRYLLSLDATGQNIKFFYPRRPSSPDPSADGPLELRVPVNCTIVLELDPGWNWEFRHENPVTLSTPHDLYFNLAVEVSANGRCRAVSFYAQYFEDGASGNLDAYNLYLVLYQGDGSEIPLLIAVDPDIKNPGDDP